MKKINKSSFYTKLVYLWILSIFLDSYMIVNIKGFQLTTFIIMTAIIVIYNIIQILKIKKLFLDKSQIIALLIIFYLIINCCLTGAENTNSLLYSEFFFITYFFITKTNDKIDEKKIILLFKKIMNILALYGIYQFFGRLYNLPFADIVIDNHMVSGYNWSNLISIGKNTFWRSNAIFKEPSFYSQFLAINILLLISNFLTKKEKNSANIFWIVINIIALLLSFSGTGIIVLFVGFIIYFFKSKKDIIFNGKLIFYFLLGIIVFSILLTSNVGKYFVGRISEVFTYQENSFSGYARFRGGSEILSNAWKQNFLLGIGIGTVDTFIVNLNDNKIVALNGFYRPACELGLIGIILWIVFIILVFLKKSENKEILIFESILFPLLICHEAFLSNYFWMILIFINSFVKNEEVIYEK